MSEGYPGVCPILKCPLCTGGARCILSMEDVVQHISKDQIKDYNILACSLSSIQCGRCHRRRNLFVEDIDIAEATSKMESRIRLHQLEAWRLSLHAFDRGHIDVPEFYNSIVTEYCIDMVTSRDDRAAHELMSDILKVVRNPERRASLQLRHLKFRPRVWTPCCENEQCFRCRTRDFHTGRTCEEIADSLAGDIVRCGVCGVHVVKGDGCDSITCVCGNNFSFNTELAKVNAAIRFQEAYPENTARICVWVQCGSAHGNLANAAAWEQCHKEECMVHYADWWLSTHARYPSQQALQMSAMRDRVPVGGSTSRALQMWIAMHSEEVEKCRLQQEIAVTEIASCCCTTEQERIEAARALVRGRQPTRQRRNDVVVESPYWSMLRGLTQYERNKVLEAADTMCKNDESIFTPTPEKRTLALYNSAMQFIILFGTREVRLHIAEAGSSGAIPCYQISGGRPLPAPPLAHWDGPAGFFDQFVRSFALHVGDMVSRLDGGAVKNFGTIATDNGDGTYEVRWGSCRVDTLHRASLKFERPCVFIAPDIAMSKQQCDSFESYLEYLRVLLSSEGDGFRAKDALVEVWEGIVGEPDSTVAAEEAERLKRVLRAVHCPEDLHKLCDIDSVLPDYRGCRLRWVDLYFACGWAGAKGRHLYE
jgi:hypothetical protein